MLNVQRFLIDHGFEELVNQFAIKLKYHDTEPLVILNYNQIESPKTNCIVRECRGLVLNKNDYSLVARSMNRFFNWGELQDEMDQFNFTDFSCQTKEDGSLVLIYYWNNQWFANTRGSFAEDLMQFQNFTWGEGFLKALNISNLNQLDFYLDRNIIYICEFCSLWNKVVRTYQEPIMYSLTGFSGYDELSYNECEQIVSDKLKRPDRHHFNSISDIQLYLTDRSSSDPTYEGVVIRDVNNLRYKIKSSYYLGLHQLRGNGLWNPKHLLPFILANETSELLVYYPEIEPIVNYYIDQLDEMCNNLDERWKEVKDIEDQKEFAFFLSDFPMNSILFKAKKSNQDPIKILKQDETFILDRMVKYHEL